MTSDPPTADQLALRRVLQKRVRDGELTPNEAEVEAAHLELPPFVDLSTDTRDITANSTWWLPMAALFYAWQELAALRREYQRFRVWGGDLWRDPQYDTMVMPLSEAEDRLRADLAGGLVRSFGTGEDHGLTPIPREEWKHLDFKNQMNLAQLPDGDVAYSGVFVLRHEVVPLWLSETPVVPASSPPMQRERSDQTTPRRGGGRATIHDWASAAGFVAGDIIENDYPAVEADLCRKLERWFLAESRKVPDARDVQRFVSQVLAARPSK